jgi:flagellar basal-body rod modification protein FlgD
MLNPSQNSTMAAAPVMSLNAGHNTQAKNAVNKTPQIPGSGVADAKKNSAKGGVEESQDRFLKLLVTQMKNQDPLNPMDNAQVTSQMAQLSTVSGIDKLNKTLEALSNSMVASHSMQASAMIGHTVLAPGNRLELKNGKAIAALDLNQAADNVTVQIKDASGNVVRNLNMGSQQSGVVPLEWDGKNDADTELAEGSYQFSASAKLGGDKSIAATLAYGKVSAVVEKPEGAKLKVEQLGEVGMDAVKQIL